MSFFKKVFLTGAVLALVFSNPQANASGEGWETDLDTALEKAKETGKTVLADFTGSDWCKWCVTLDKEVFSQDLFKTFAAENLILCAIDFPKDKSKLAEGQEEKNNGYRERYPVPGYPTVLLLEPTGDFFLKTGYRKGGAEPYVAFLKKVIGFRGKMKGFLAKEKPDLEKAEAILKKIPEDAQILRALFVIAVFPEERVVDRARAAYVLVQAKKDDDGKLLKYLESVAAQDPENHFKKITVENLNQKLMAGMGKMMKAYDASLLEGAKPELLEKARAAAEKMIAATEDVEKKFEQKQMLQVALVIRTMAFRVLDNQEGVDVTWAKAEAIDPKARVIEWARTRVKPTEK
jgi:protein disulfide-isomerase